MRRIIVPAYKYDEESNTVLDRYVCSKCFKIVKEERRAVVGNRKGKRNSVIYYMICSKCKSEKIKI